MSALRDPLPPVAAKRDREPPTTVAALPRGSISQLANAFRAFDSLFVSPRWLAVIEETFDCHVQAMTASSGGETKGGFLFSDIDDIRGRRMVSLPFSDYADPFVEDAATWQRLVDPLFAIGAPLRFRCLHNSVAAADKRFEAVQHLAWHGVNLQREAEQIWAGLQPAARQNIRKAEAAGLRVRIGRSVDDLRAFYAMHCRVRKGKYRLFAQPFRLFENLASAFSGTDDLFVLLAEIDGVPIAGILFLVHGDTLYYKFNASSDVRFRPNDLLVWSGLQIGRERGLARLDFGVSDLDQPGLVAFKRKFATEERLVTELRWAGDVRRPSHRDRDAGALLGQLTSILTSPEVPDEVTRAVGDQLYRYFV